MVGAMARGTISEKLYRHPVWALGATAFVLQFCDVFLVVAAFSLFMRRIGASNLPQIYVVLNFISIVMQLVMLSRQKVSTFDLVVKMTVILLVTVLAATVMVNSAYTAFFFLLFIIVRMHDILCLTYFINYAQSVFPVRIAKANIARILGFSSLATILGGFSVKPMVSWLSFPALFLFGALMLVLVLAMMATCARLWPPPTTKSEKNTKEGGMSRLAGSFSVLKVSKLARNIVFVWFFFTFLRYLVDFQFSRSAALIFTSEADLAGFFGVFQSSLAMITALGQFTIASDLLRFFKLGGVMCLGPLLQLGLCVAISGYPWPWLIIALQALWTLGFQITTRPSFTILLVPLEDSTRDRVSLLSSMAAAFGSLISGVFLLVFKDLLSLPAYFITLALFNGIFVVVALRLDRHYMSSVEERVASADSGAKINALEALGYLGRGQDLTHLTQLIRDDDPIVRRKAVERLTVLPPEKAEPLICEILDKEDDGYVLATVATNMGDILGKRTLPVLRELVSKADDTRVRANAIEALGLHGDSQDEELLLTYLKAKNHRVRANAIVSLLQVARSKSLLEQALVSLVGMMKHSVPTMRSAALAAVGRMNFPCFSGCVFTGLRDDEVSVRRNAIRALSRMRPAEALRRLKDVAEEDPSKDIREQAKKVCKLIEEQKVDELLRHAGKLTPSQREQAAAILHHTAEGGQSRVLRRVLASQLTSLPEELLPLCRLIDDEDLLDKVADCFEEGKLTLRPLLAYLDKRFQGQHPQGIPLLGQLGSAFGDAATKDALEPYLNAISVLHSSPGNFELERQGLVEHLVLWSAVLGSQDDGRAALQKSIEGAMNKDSHIASLSMEALETKLKPTVFELLSPYLEVCNDEKSLQKYLKELKLTEIDEDVIRILTIRLPKDDLSEVKKKYREMCGGL